MNWNTADIPGTVDAITQSSDAQDGISSVKIEVFNVLGHTYPGNLQSMDSINSYGHPITEKYSNLSGYYKFSPNGSADLQIIVSIHNDIPMLIGVGGLDIYNPVANWTYFNIPINYFDEDPASRNVSISIIDTATTGSGLSTVGSTTLIDNLTLGNPTYISENSNVPLNYSLSQNYLNPFNPSTIIKYSIPNVTSNFGLSNVTLNIYDILGREIATLVNK